MDVEQFKQDVREGRSEVDRLVELIVTQQRDLQAARRRIEELERRPGGSGSAKVGAVLDACGRATARGAREEAA